MFRRLSILGTLLLAACVPSYGPGALTSTASCFNKAPTKAETTAWRKALTANTAKAYRAFINAHPRSCYVPQATEKLSSVVKRPPSVARDIAGGGSGGGGSAY